MSELTEKLINEYKEKRKKAEKERKQRINSTYEKYPEIKDIDEKIKNCGIGCMNKIISDPTCSDDINSYLKSEMEKLKAKRAEILLKYNIEPSFDKCIYECSACKDTGFVENKKCSCFIQKELNEEFNSSNMGEKQKNHLFENFDFSYYSDIEKEDGISHLERMKKIYSVSKSFTENFDNINKSILFYGNPGTGKTFLSSCIGNEMIKKGKTVLYARAGRVFDIFEKNHFRSNDKDNKLIEKVYSCDLLIIDDLGTEFQTKNTASFLYDFFDERMSNNKKVIINTNYNMAELEKLYTVRFTSRIYENFLIFRFCGEDIRPRLNEALM